MLIFQQKKLERWKDYSSYSIEITSVASNASNTVSCAYCTITSDFLSNDLLTLYSTGEFHNLLFNRGNSYCNSKLDHKLLHIAYSNVNSGITVIILVVTVIPLLTFNYGKYKLISTFFSAMLSSHLL